MLQARAVLDDCEAAFLELKSASQDTLRRRWFTTVALLRAVGHVLRNIDGNKSSPDELRTAITKQFKGWEALKPEPLIFWGFIYEERNSVLKLYRFFAVRGQLSIGGR